MSVVIEKLTYTIEEIKECESVIKKVIGSKVLTEDETVILTTLFSNAECEGPFEVEVLYWNLLGSIEDIYGDKKKIAVIKALSKNITNWGDVCVMNDYFDEWFELTFTEHGYYEYLQVCKSINKEECDIIKVTGKTLKDLHDKMIEKLTPDITTIIYSLKAPLETEEDLKTLHAKLAVKCPEALPHGQWIKDDKIEALILIGKNN